MQWQRAWTLGVLGLALVWGLMLASGIRFSMRDMGVSSVYAVGGDSYPLVREARPYAPLGDSALQPGDVLISVNGHDLRGLGPVGFFNRAAARMRDPGVPVVYERAGVRAETHLPLVSNRLFRASLLLSFSL
jgi:hypothetical protein